MRFWFARLAGTSANQMLMVAIGWQMYDLTASAWDLGLVGLMQFMPSLLLVLVAGHVLDRYHRARILAACMALQAAVAAALALAAWQGWASRDLLLALSVLIGAAKAFQLPAQQAITPLLVPAEVLPRALAFSSAGMQGAIIAGPALGGFVYVAGAPAVYASCTALFLLSCAMVLGVRYEHVARIAGAATLDTLLAGVRFVRQREVVLGAISLDLFAVLLGGASALLPMFAKDVLHVGPWGLGLLRAAPAVGALVTALALSHWPIRQRAGFVLLSSVGVYGAAMLGFALSTQLLLSMLMLAISGAADMVSVVIRQSLVQLETPDEMRGRVSAVNSVFIGASNQLGEFESGVTAALLGPVGSVVLGGLGSMAIAALWVRWFPALARRDRLVETPP
ncbi:MFS transporter [Rhizobacter sp. AJA081-3]|uniref:MFS transporter n=1 Tax=Rhizobacter sp. AJA081-3 TaxID=2753607 RepID=UPI001ADF18AA|nr:MFS transporter [Rhizobacter sp. AJA081-3]QTN25852.1 MFS transporter [Rhizobacter sp. AJA081-3]